MVVNLFFHHFFVTLSLSLKIVNCNNSVLFYFLSESICNILGTKKIQKAKKDQGKTCWEVTNWIFVTAICCWSLITAFQGGGKEMCFFCAPQKGEDPLHINSEKWNFLDCSGSGVCPIWQLMEHRRIIFTELKQKALWKFPPGIQVWAVISTTKNILESIKGSTSKTRFL